METVPWTEIPDLALQRILDYADLRSQKNALLVSKRWNENQSLVGLVVNIDDRREGMEDFLQRTVIKEANIHFLGNQESILDSLPNARALTFSNYVNPSIFAGFLHGRTWNNLTKIFFGGSSLITQDWVSANVNDDQVVHVTFSHLKELDIRLSSEMIVQTGNHFGRKREQRMRDVVPVGPVVNPNDSNNSMQIRLALEIRAIMNVKYLMQSIRSPVLTSFHISAVSFFEKNPGKESTSSINDFLGAHRKTLQKLILQRIYSNFGFIEGSVPLAPLEFPLRGLKSLLLTVIPEQMRENFVNDLICTQEALEDLGLTFEALSLGRATTEFITNLVVMNWETLTYLSLSGLHNGRNKNRQLDLGLLRSCSKLKILKLGSGRSSGRVHLKNLNKLPCSLEVLEAGYGVGTAADFNGAEFIWKMRNLELLTLYCVQRHGKMGRKEDVSRFIQTALLHRRLYLLDLKFKDLTDSEYAQGTSHRSKALFHPLLAQLFKPDNEVEFETFYAGIGGSRSPNRRHYFDLVAVNADQVQPLNMDHGSAKSYSAKVFLDPALSEGDQGQGQVFGYRRPQHFLVSVTPSTKTAFDLDARFKVGSEVCLSSIFHVQDSAQSKLLTKIYRRQKWGQKEPDGRGPGPNRNSVDKNESVSDNDSDSDFMPVIPTANAHGHGSDSESGEDEEVAAQYQNLARFLPAIEVNESYQVRKVKKLD